MAIKLKPCPFCGGKARILGGETPSFSVEYAVHCEACAVETRPGSCLATKARAKSIAREIAAERWNRRVSIAEDSTP